MTLKSDVKFGEKLTCGLDEKFGQFLPEHLKVSELGL